MIKGKPKTLTIEGIELAQHNGLGSYEAWLADNVKMRLSPGDKNGLWNCCISLSLRDRAHGMTVEEATVNAAGYSIDPAAAVALALHSFQRITVELAAASNACGLIEAGDTADHEETVEEEAARLTECEP